MIAAEDAHEPVWPPHTDCLRQMADVVRIARLGDRPESRARSVEGDAAEVGVGRGLNRALCFSPPAPVLLPGACKRESAAATPFNVNGSVPQQQHGVGASTAVVNKRAAFPGGASGPVCTTPSSSRMRSDASFDFHTRPRCTVAAESAPFPAAAVFQDLRHERADVRDERHRRQDPRVGQGVAAQRATAPAPSAALIEARVPFSKP